MKLVLLGAPGAGKGTQATVLSESLHLPHISTGDIFRANLKAQTPLGQEAKKFMDQGLLVPDTLTVDMLLDRISQEDCQNGYILDGFPRTLSQAAALDEHETIDAVLNISVEDEAIIARMAGRRVCPSCGEPYHTESKKSKVEGICDRCGAQLIRRADDEPETVRKRLVVYHDQTQPLEDYYQKQGKLHTVDGLQALEVVSSELLTILKKLGSCEE